MVKKINFSIILCFLLFIPIFLSAQTNEQSLARRIVWRGGENALRYAVEIDRSQGGIYRNHLRSFTTDLSIVVSLPPGDYRFRIIPHDILDRPSEGTQWMHFGVRPALITESSSLPAEREQIQEINIDDFSSTGTLISESPASPASELDALLESSRITNSQAARFVLASAGDEAEDPFEQAMSSGWFPKNAEPDKPINLGTLSFLMMNAFEIKGGFLYFLFPGPRYAFRTMKSRSYIQDPSDPDMTLSGERFLLILGNVLSTVEEAE